MPRYRTIAAMLAMSALLLAGWTNATHFHFGGVHAGAAHRHSETVGADCATSECPESASDRQVSSVIPSRNPCCTSGQAASDAACMAEQAESGPMLSEAGHTAHEHGSCLICDFLSGQSDGLSVSFQFAGMVAAGSALPELLHASPARTLCRICCRGPPVMA